MLSRDRTGRFHGPIKLQQDFDLPANGEVFMGGLYRVVNGMLVLPADDATQDHCITVMALEHRSNQGGQDRARRARCIVDGIALVPASEVAETEIGKPVYPVSDDGITSSAPPDLPNNQPAGTLLAIDGSVAKLKLG